MVGDAWWKSAVVYQIYPRSFLDTPIQTWADDGHAYRAAFPAASLTKTGGDGIGDLEGIRRGLDYLCQLGVDTVWLSPFYRSPMADFGYDVADYCDVDPLFGTLADFDRMLADAHERGLRVIIDWVPNHSSDHHPWFEDARSSRAAEHRDWYVWRDPIDPETTARTGDPGPPPNNWTAAFTGGPAWSWDAHTGQWYLHLFLPQQPDLNWNNPAVVAAMHDTLRFWLDRGVDGFRIDVVHGLGKDPALADLPAAVAHVPVSALNDDPRTHPILRELRYLVDSYPHHPVLVGEVYLLDTAKVAKYYGVGDELHLAFNFPPLYAPWEAPAWRAQIERTVEQLDPLGAWPTWVLSNHDNPRHRTRYGSMDRARAAAVLLLGLRGTPFLYAGEELGLGDAAVPAGRQRDPGGRDGGRAPIPWDDSPSHGWPTTEPWLPWPPEADVSNAAVEASDASSMLGLYRRLLASRRASAALTLGDFGLRDSPAGLLVWERHADGDRRLVVVNFTGLAHRLHLDQRWTIEVASDGSGEGAPFTGLVAPNQALLLR